MWQFAADMATWMLAANRTPEPQAWGASRMPRAEAIAAIRRISVNPPARAMSGWAMSTARWKNRSSKSKRVNSRSPVAMGITVERRTSARPGWSSGETGSSNQEMSNSSN